MKNLNALTIFILTFFNIVHLHGNKFETDLQKMKEILKEYKTKAISINRKVIMNDEEVSLENYYDVEKFDSKAEMHKIYKVFHILNIVLSCEYSEISYHYIKSIDQYFLPCITKVKDTSERFDGKLKALNECFIKYHSTYLDYLLEHTQSMVLSLASLVEYTKNIMFKNHEILRILLSWHAFLYQIKMSRDSKENLEERLKRLESIMITNVQIKHRLERFLMKHCYRREQFKRIITKVTKNIRVDFELLLKLNGERIEGLSSPVHERITNKFVINPSNLNFENLIDILVEEFQSGSIHVIWNFQHQNLKQIYVTEIKNTSDISLIVDYEKKILEVLYEIIVFHEIKALRELMETDQNEDILSRWKGCNALVKNIKNFIEKKKLEGYHDQPIDLLKFLFYNKKSLSYLCSLMANKENDKIIITRINTMENNLKYIARFKGTSKFGTFLDTLSTTVIGTKLHPVILNTFWEQNIVYDSPEVRFYGVDYQHLYKEYNKSTVDNFICRKALQPLKTLRSLQNQLIDCIGVSDKKNCFTGFHINYDQIIVQVAYVAVNSYELYSNDWEKLLLTLIHNKENIELFDPVKQEKFDDKRLEHLITFLSIMENLYIEKLLVKCNCNVFSTFQEIGKCPEPKNVVIRYLNEDIKDVTELKTIQKLVDGVLKYNMHIQYVTEHVQKLLNNFQSKNHCTMYWDGIPSNLNEVHANYKMYMFDLQDAYDYTSYFIKWIISIPFTKLMQLLFKGLDEKNLKYIIREGITNVKASITKFLKIDLLSHASIEYYFEDFFIAIELFYNGKKDDAMELLLDLFDEFNFINIVETTDQNLFSNWVQDFSSEINQLMVVFDMESDVRLITIE